MRRAVIAALYLAACSIASAQSDVSAPAGFVRFGLAPQSQTLIGLPLDPAGSTLQDLLAGQLAAGDRVLVWNAAAQTYKELAESPVPARPGDAFWIENNEASFRSVYLFGHAVLDASFEVPLQPALNLHSYPYTTANGDWQLGEGDWLLNAQTQLVAWTLARPYEDVFDTEQATPRIEDIGLGSNGIVLSIETAGLTNIPLAILYQDLGRTSVLDTARGWVLAEVLGGSSLHWVDAGATNRPSPSQVFARLYLVVPADRDANGNGVADVQELGDFGTLAVVDVPSSSQSEEQLSSSGELSLGAGPGSESGLASTNAPPAGFIITYERPVIYVDALRGSDQFTGRKAVRVGQDGPKKTIRAGIEAADGAGSVVAEEGIYRESVSVAGRDVTLSVQGGASLSAVGDMAGYPPPVGQGGFTNELSAKP